jgi:hypothetical protein
MNADDQGGVILEWEGPEATDGALAPRAAWRAALVPASSHDVVGSDGETAAEPDEDAHCARPSGAGWVQVGRVDAGGGPLASMCWVVHAAVGDYVWSR